MRHDRVQHPRGAVGEDPARQASEPLEDRAHLRIGLEPQVRVHQARALGGSDVEAEPAAGEDERGPGDGPEVLVAPHEGAEPGVFELLGAPEVGQRLRIPGDRAPGLDDRVDVEEGAGRVEEEPLHRHRPCLP